MGFQDVSKQTNHLIRRDGIWYYRRRVPHAMQATFGKKEIQLSLGTPDLAEAKKRRAVEDLKFSARFGCAVNCTVAASPASDQAAPAPVGSVQPSDDEIIRLVQEYVTVADKRAQRCLALDPPGSTAQREQITDDIEIGVGILKNPDDPRGHQWVDQVGSSIIKNAGTVIDGVAMLDAVFAGFVRRGLLELQKRKLSTLDNDHEHLFFDPVFDPTRKLLVKFGELADQVIQVAREEATANGTSLKWIDKQQANCPG
jgi:hypothetical protein